MAKQETEGPETTHLVTD